MKRTPWFPGTVKPMRVGVYEREYGEYDFLYCRWDGKYWYACAMTPKQAEKAPGLSAMQNLPWRGVMK
jgi:hypothetical protein